MKLGLLLVALAMFTLNAATQTKPQDLAQHAAASWLALLDSGKYADCWQGAAQTFKAHVSQDEWLHAASASRDPLGKLQSRKLKSAAYKTSLPGAPDGQYVILQYTTSFAHKQSAIETVTPMLDKDGTWRVAGYFVQ